MPVESVLVVVITLALTAITSWFIVVPFFRESSLELDTTADILGSLLLKKDMLLRNLEELEGEFQSKKIREADYHTEREKLSAKLAHVLRELDQMGHITETGVHASTEQERKRTSQESKALS